MRVRERTAVATPVTSPRTRGGTCCCGVPAHRLARIGYRLRRLRRAVARRRLEASQDRGVPHDHSQLLCRPHRPSRNGTKIRQIVVCGEKPRATVDNLLLGTKRYYYGTIWYAY